MLDLPLNAVIFKNTHVKIFALHFFLNFNVDSFSESEI